MSDVADIIIISFLTFVIPNSSKRLKKKCIKKDNSIRQIKLSVNVTR